MESFIASEKLDGSVIFEGALNHEATRQKLARTLTFLFSRASPKDCPSR